MFEECMCDVTDYGQIIDNYRMYQTKAKRNYQCIECHEIIPVGTEHRAVTGCYEDGDIANIRTCNKCARIYDDFGFCWHGCMWDSLEQQWGEDAYLLR